MKVVASSKNLYFQILMFQQHETIPKSFCVPYRVVSTAMYKWNDLVNTCYNFLLVPKEKIRRMRKQKKRSRPRRCLLTSGRNSKKRSVHQLHLNFANQAKARKKACGKTQKSLNEKARVKSSLQPEG